LKQERQITRKGSWGGSCIINCAPRNREGYGKTGGHEKASTPWKDKVSAEAGKETKEFGVESLKKGYRKKSLKKKRTGKSHPHESKTEKSLSERITYEGWVPFLEKGLNRVKRTCSGKKFVGRGRMGGGRNRGWGNFAP